MTSALKRWVHFSLSTLFVVMMVFACWLGWQLKMVRDREALLQRAYYYGSSNYITNPRPHSDLPFYRVWLGDRQIERIETWSEADATEAARLFPEVRELFFAKDGLVKEYDLDRKVSVETNGPSTRNDRRP